MKEESAESTWIKFMILIIGGACQGKTTYAKEHFEKKYTIIDEYHMRVREQLIEGKDPLKEAEVLLTEKEDCVIISNEVGYGLVPVEAFEREYREAVGRVNCYLAEKAGRVIRIVCGIGTKLK